MFFSLHSQHSGARRADEAARRDVGVSHAGLAALEAVFVYSGLGQLADLAGADRSERESSLPEYITAHSLNLKLQMLCSPALTDHGVRTQANPKNSSMFLTG